MQTNGTKTFRAGRSQWNVAPVLAAMVVGMLATGVFAASQTWTGLAGDGLWITPGNWSGNAPPGAVTTNNNDVATFNGPVGAVSPIIFDDHRNLASFLFDTASAGAYTFQHPSWDGI